MTRLQHRALDDRLTEALIDEDLHQRDEDQSEADEPECGWLEDPRQRDEDEKGHHSGAEDLQSRPFDALDRVLSQCRLRHVVHGDPTSDSAPPRTFVAMASQP